MTHLLTRLDPLYGDETPIAEGILDSVAGQREVDSSVFADGRPILLKLIDDHYLVQRGGRISWRYDALRRIWVHRRGLR